MAHLTCKAHGRRVVINPDTHIARHRGRDSEVCDSDLFNYPDGMGGLATHTKESIVGAPLSPFRPKAPTGSCDWINLYEKEKDTFRRACIDHHYAPFANLDSEKCLTAEKENP